MGKPLWRLLLEDPSSLSCNECFAVMEYYADLLASGGEDLWPQIRKRLEDCPPCELEHRRALRLLVKANGEVEAADEEDEMSRRSR